MRRSLLQLALYSACKPRVYVPFRAPSAPSPYTYSRDNGTGTTKPQGCDVALCMMQLSQFVSFARGAQRRVARHVALRLLLGKYRRICEDNYDLAGGGGSLIAISMLWENLLLRIIRKRKGYPFFHFFCSLRFQISFNCPYRESKDIIMKKCMYIT